MWGCTLPRTPLLSYSCGPLPEKSMTDLAFPRLLIPSFFLGATGMLCVAMARSTLPIVIAGALKAVSQGAAQPAIQAYSIRYLGKERAGGGHQHLLYWAGFGKVHRTDFGELCGDQLELYCPLFWIWRYAPRLRTWLLLCAAPAGEEKTQSSDWKNIERRRLLAYNGREPLRKGVSILWQN